MVLFRLPNLVELDAVPTYYISRIALVELDGPVCHVLLGNERTIAGELVCTPQLEIVRPLACIARDSQLLRRILADAIGVQVERMGLH